MADDQSGGVDRKEHYYGIGDALRALRSPVPPFGGSTKVLVPGQEANRESVSWMLEQAAAQAEEQSARLDSLQLRAGQLAGFAGILLGLLASLVPDGFAEIGGPVRYLAQGSFIVALVLLLTAIMLALLFVVRPRKFREVSPAEWIDEFLADRRRFKAEPWQLQLARLRSYPEALRWHAWVNKRRAAALFLAYFALAGGLVASAVSIGTIGIDGGRSQNAGAADRGQAGGHELGSKGR